MGRAGRLAGYAGGLRKQRTITWTLDASDWLAFIRVALYCSSHTVLSDGLIEKALGHDVRLEVLVEELHIIAALRAPRKQVVSPALCRMYMYEIVAAPARHIMYAHQNVWVGRVIVAARLDQSEGAVFDAEIEFRPAEL